MNLLEVLGLLDNLAHTPLENIKLRHLEQIYERLLDFFAENNAELDKQFVEALGIVIYAISQELERKKKKLPRLSEHLIKNPSEVEQILSLMTLPELIAAEKSGLKRIKCPQLRKQFSNMVMRCMQAIFLRAGLPDC